MMFLSSVLGFSLNTANGSETACSVSLKRFINNHWFRLRKYSQTDIGYQKTLSSHSCHSLVGSPHVMSAKAGSGCEIKSSSLSLSALLCCYSPPVPVSVGRWRQIEASVEEDAFFPFTEQGQVSSASQLTSL